MSAPMPDELKAFRSLWWLFLLFGLLTLAAGIIVLVWPHVGLATLAIIIGIVLIVRGIAFTAAGWQIRKLPPDDGAGVGGEVAPALVDA